MTDASPTSEPNSIERNAAVSDAMWHGGGGWEIAAVPLLLGFCGWGLDGVVGTRPLLAILGTLLGLIGAIANQYYRYMDRMRSETQEWKAAREAKFGTGDGPRFGAVPIDEAPSYVLESDLGEATP